MNKHYIEGLVSVIIPVYNSELYLKRCLESVLNNSYRKLELLLVDDGSTDNSLQILRHYAETDSRVKLISKPNGGASSARNKGLEIAQGEWVSFVDADDFVHKDFYTILLQGANTNAADVVICGYIRVDHRINDMPIDAVLWEDVSHSQIVFRREGEKVWDRIYKHAAVEKYRFPESVNYIQDLPFNLFVFSNENIKTIKTEQPLYYYCMRPGSAVSNYLPKDYYQISDWVINNLECFNHNDYAVIRAFKYALFCRYMAHVVHTGRSFNKRSRQLLIKAQREIIKCNGISLPLKFKSILAANCIPIYRLKLLLNDKTMLSFERHLKDRYRTAKKEGDPDV